MAIENATNNTVLSSVKPLAAASTFSSNRTSLEAVEATSTGNAAQARAASSGQTLPALLASLLSGTMSQSNTRENSPMQDAVQSDADLLATPLLKLGNGLSDSALSVMQSELLSALHKGVLQYSSQEGKASIEDTSDSHQTDFAIASASQSETGSLFDNLYTQAFGLDGLNLQDGFDALNIVNHLPVISDLYEATTEKEASPVSSLAGSFIYGGVGGLMYNAVDLSIQGLTGESISTQIWSLGESIFSSVFAVPKDSQAPLPTQLTSNPMSEDIGTSATNAAYQFVQRSF